MSSPLAWVNQHLTTLPRRISLDWRFQYLALALVWGLSFMFITVSTEVLEPLQITLGRMGAGALPLVLVLWLTRGRLPRSLQTWTHLMVTAALLNVIPFTLFGYATELIPSALAGICNAATPLFTVLVSLLLLSDERPTHRRLLGLTLGFIGILVVFAAWRGVVDADARGMLFAFGATVCYGIGNPYLRRFVSGSGHSVLELSTAQMLAGTAQLLVLTPMFTTAPTELPLRVAGAVAVLGVFGTGLAYVLMYGVIRAAGSTVASTVTYVVPVVATAAGVTLLGETLAWNEPLGALIVVAGAALCLHTAPSFPQSSRRISNARWRSAG
ncbi:DMT family transporter [Lipingzhangella sp. LS1_29]|uniref:DMT family transporter n=1 Tax=Lipingzhangella rawalii TaxID=2055835 RepID=A0ABU2H252_9ACTN|nr:DMT family transporter [Lipingzhangella rawalii]MDS1269383.1 DMT family transporter [Lipingzhangella rawalii]